MKRISILGSTGSIGRQTLDVVRQHKDKFEVVAISANSSIDLLLEQIKEFKPKYVAVYDEVSAIKSNYIDLAVFDATIGDVSGDHRIFEHNNLNMVVEMKTSLEKYIKRVCISHMARTLHTSHAELSDRMKAHGIEVAFDGFETKI